MTSYKTLLFGTAVLVCAAAPAIAAMPPIPGAHTNAMPPIPKANAMPPIPKGR
ncbi:MAG: hypothetical protein M3Z14_06040 [Candidatus Eremiobacteraeota bacterium]|nr:hypothetical protein [Candidatus Eremiobacteraeota bacterium]